MNDHIKKLYEMSNAPSRVVIGLMSGTSLDGLDVALCRFQGSGLDTKTELLEFKTIPYAADFKEELKSISFKEQVDLQKVTLLNARIGTYHGELILQCLQEWGIQADTVDVIASHGQTIFHAPKSLHQLAAWPNATLQIGDGDHLAVKTGVITLSDFRQKHIAAGGEGAPLAVYGDYLIFSSPDEHRILLNIGGIANFTYLPSGRKSDLIFSTDVGPGNTIMDQFVQLHYPGLQYDANAALASAGTVNQILLKELLRDPFFELTFPKTTGPELFNLAYLNKALAASEQMYPEEKLKISNEDILATLCEFTATGIADAIVRSIANLQQVNELDQKDFQPGEPINYEIYLSGGGMHNPLIVQKISEKLNRSLKDTRELEIDPDAKEAILFALLANECITGGRLDFGSRPGLPSVCMGKISLPT
ncbi:anhydro-N-acetylmuramic acid kinase [Pedobacter immunditicola]|uniref:anhydro-N-acetylmuramic acid kinase n=1 Tax=Pedobacter immunditicola TaxID=3133440 RepID=UPI0030B0A109